MNRQAVNVMLALGALLTLLQVGCTQPKSARCHSLCARESECVELAKRENESSFDEKQCVAACASLEAEPKSVHNVTAHEQCVQKAADCNAVLNCR